MITYCKNTVARMSQKINHFLIVLTQSADKYIVITVEVAKSSRLQSRKCLIFLLTLRSKHNSNGVGVLPGEGTFEKRKQAYS